MLVRRRNLRLIDFLKSEVRMQNLEGRTEPMLDPEPRTESMEVLEARTGFTEELAEESIQNTVEDAEKEKTYRDIHERTFEFACTIVRLHSELIRHGVTRRSVVNQLLRAATSVGANLEEARGGQSKAD